MARKRFIVSFEGSEIYGPYQDATKFAHLETLRQWYEENPTMVVIGKKSVPKQYRIVEAEESLPRPFFQKEIQENHVSILSPRL